MTLRKCERGDCQEYIGSTYWECTKKTTRGEILVNRAICCAECAAAYFGGSEPESFSGTNS